VEGHSPWPRDARDPKPVLIPDVANEPTLASFLPLFQKEQIGALAFIPLVAAGRLFGKFMVYYDGPYELSAQELAMASAIANHLGSVTARFSLVAELKQSVRFYEMFTGILGHDLRNPLGAIMTAAQIAVMRGEGERLAKPLSRILTSGERMARMIDQLLDLTRVRVGRGIPLDAKRFDIVSMLGQVIDEIDVANPHWTLRLEHSGDTEGFWDMDRLSQVFSNLVANAVQHGSVEHGVVVRVDGSAQQLVRIDVHNGGKIAETLLPVLFEPLASTERRRDKSHGLGLGLFISREIVRAHAGTIDVRSNDDGTTFTVLLPRSVPAASEPR